jgi:S1-C subfamily serine protease
LDRARTAVAEGAWGRAWVLVANRAEASDQKTALLADLEADFAREQASAQARGEARKARDLGATLALVRTGTWEAPPPPEAAAAAPSAPAQWLQGTATVVVNKGLKVENGSAQPDIVIGSGFFVSPQGLLLTNHHVIESEVEPGASPSSRLSVRLPGSKGERLPAKVVGWDKNLDLALLKVEYKPPYVFSLSTGADPLPGQRLQAIGSPGGLEASLTEGIVSAAARPLLALGEVLQIDVAVNPGNSGGPLVDAQGRVVGVIFAGIRDFQGVNFAIPASLVRRVYPLLEAGGRISLPWVGLGLQEDAQGVEVLYVVPRGPADEAGIRVGDRLTGVAGTPVKEIAQAQVRLLDFGTDAVVPLDLVRDGKPLRLWSTVAIRPDLPLKDAALKDLTSRVFPLAFGAVVEDMAQGVDRSFRVKRIWPGTPAEELGLSENDPIEVVDWVVDTKNEAVSTQWKIKRRLGGWLESTVSLAVPYQSRLFL